MTELGAKTGLEFGKGDFGPFAEGVKQVLHAFANKNWIVETQLGRMSAVRASEQYERDRRQFQELILRHQSSIRKAVDLFSRVRSTEQAEVVFTVTDEQIQNFIVDWKPAWAAEAKRLDVADAISNLAMLGWLKVEISQPVETD
jgi:hypothetical protein